jgi:hypothetical protein
MGSDQLVAIFGQKAATQDQVKRLEASIERYGQLSQTYFRGLNRPIGIELEMEAANEWVNYASSKNNTYWRVTKDGSLKDQGIELVSFPISGHNIDYALLEIERFFSHAKSVGGLPRASVRTSTHVHADVSDFSRNHLEPLTALYALFEPLFFSQCSKARQNNPYCYPITELLPSQVEIDPQMKYCAFNPAPIQTQLSVEFRHGDFTTDIRALRRWIQLVAKFMHFSGKNRERLKEIVQRAIMQEEYAKLFSAVFGHSTILFEGLDVQKLMKANSLWAGCVLELA